MAQSHANRGLKFESFFYKKCKRLQEDGIALIHKVPTEFKMIRNGARVVSAFPVSESHFVDFIGIFKGRAIGIECKETQNKTSFPFSNIKKTQIEFFNTWCAMGGLGYYLIRFTELKRIYLVDGIVFNQLITTIGRKSAPLKWFEETAFELDYNEINLEDFIDN